MSVRVIARDDDGTETDITEAVIGTYEAIRSSMDWGSGFLSIEEVLHITRVASACQLYPIGVAESQAAAYEDRYIETPCPVCHEPGLKLHEKWMADPDAPNTWDAMWRCGHKGTITGQPGGPASLTMAPSEHPTTIELLPK